ncbi:MAG: Peptidase family [Candidatus Parcubacteria bacterium]
MNQWKQWTALFLCVVFVAACEPPMQTQEDAPHGRPSRDGLSIDADTGIPFARTFQHPIEGMDASDYGFGFGTENRWFCMKTGSTGACTAYGAHLGRDTLVEKTPVGTEVRAPADGIVRISTDISFGGYGSDTKQNPSYQGCALVLEHLFANGEAVTTLLGHLRCDDEDRPRVGDLVARGERVGSVGNYWHGESRTTNWHHVHWAMRKGRFAAPTYTKADLLPYVAGYAPRSEFRNDPATGALVHPSWLDPFGVIAANGDPAAQASATVRHHPSGSFLQDPDGAYWLVTDNTHIASVSPSVAARDRYPVASAIPVTDEEIGCYHEAPAIASDGPVALYVRPNTSAVVLAYEDRQERYDMIRWEAFLSWGFQDTDILHTPSAAFYEQSYRDRGFKLIRPGTLVKANESPEVSIVTMQQTRLPIDSEETFERAGFQWNLITSIPESVIDDVAGPRESTMLTRESLQMCAVPASCPDGSATCGGGALPGCMPGDETPCWCDHATEGVRVCLEGGQFSETCLCPMAQEPPPLPSEETEREDAGSPPSTSEPSQEEPPLATSEEETVVTEPEPISAPMDSVVPEPTSVPSTPIEEVETPAEEETVPAVSSTPESVPAPDPTPSVTATSAPEETTPPVSTSDPVVSVEPLTLLVHAYADMGVFKLWFVSGRETFGPETIDTVCEQTSTRDIVCELPMPPGKEWGLWMDKGTASTPWSPGLNWETGACDPFADITAIREGASVPLRMVQIGDGCRFIIDP